MSSIIIAVAIVAGIGLAAGLLLAVASKLMAVPVDEKAEAIREALPGVNCGACGFSGCDGYAAALSKGETKDTALCAPGGDEVSELIAEITGLAAGTTERTAAVVLCRGNNLNAEHKMIYSGVKSCKMAVQLYNGPKRCEYGCLGFGDCVEACQYDAVYLCDGVARINPDRCRSCKMCVAACPKGIIKLIPSARANAAVLCANKEKGALTRKKCKTGCIGCMRCVKVCECGAVSVKDFCASIDESVCIGCGKCAEICPQKCIEIIKQNQNQQRGSFK